MRYGTLRRNHNNDTAILSHLLLSAPLQNTLMQNRHCDGSDHHQAARVERSACMSTQLILHEDALDLSTRLVKKFALRCHQLHAKLCFSAWRWATYDSLQYVLRMWYIDTHMHPAARRMLQPSPSMPPWSTGTPPPAARQCSATPSWHCTLDDACCACSAHGTPPSKALHTVAGTSSAAWLPALTHGTRLPPHAHSSTRPTSCAAAASHILQAGRSTQQPTTAVYCFESP